MMRKFGLPLCFLLAFTMLAVPRASRAQVAVGISVRIGPPPLRVYAQPICPAPGYLWTPGYWAYGPDGYYWVPGAWVMAPQPGLLWTPGYWGFAEGAYVWHGGYWGPHVGFYGGIHYGYGYTGVGFWGGEWRGGRFYYNRSVTNVNINIHNTYNRTVIVHNDTRVAFNGEGGVRAYPNREEMAAEHERHFDATHEQVAHRDDARNDRSNRFDAARDNRENNRNFERANNENRNEARENRGNNRSEARENRNNNHNENRQMKQNRPAHEKNNHPQREDHKPGRGR